jgi:hypothetical protein
MRTITPVSRIPARIPLIPARASQAETPKERYKQCESEQSSLGGIASCYRTFLQEKSDDK